MFILIKPIRIKELLPVSIVGMIILFVSEKGLLSLNLYSFPNAMFPIFGISLFHLLWCGICSIIIMYYMPPIFLSKIPILIAITFALEIIEYFTETSGYAKSLGLYTDLQDSIFDFACLLLFVWICEGLFNKRIHKIISNQLSSG
jgi:hypothetical protein